MSGTQSQIVNNPSNGMLDEFGTGGVVNNAPALFQVPTELADLPQDGWFIAQWDQPLAVNPADYVVNSPSTSDAVYGNALYAWSQPGATSAISIYQNTAALGGGDVFQLTNVNSTLPPSLGAVDEADLFLSSNNIPASGASLAHPIVLSLNAKIVQASQRFINAATASSYATSGPCFSNIDIGFTINFNASGSLPAFSGFVQISPWVSDTSARASYETSPITPGDPTQFISNFLLGNDPELPLLPSDANATPEALTYNINKYALQTLEGAFSEFTPAQQAILLNLNNWSLGGMYIGLATTDVQINNPSAGTQIVEAAQMSATAQFSNISLASNLNAIYNSTDAPGIATAVDLNPQIMFSDQTMNVTGSADGGSYNGTIAGIQDEYIYKGLDTVCLTAPTGANWYFGGGSSATALAAISGSNILLASLGGSWMTSGSGADTFIIPDANAADSSTWDTVTNFHSGDSLSLLGMTSSGWTYSWLDSLGANGYTGLTLEAQSTTHAGVLELVTLAGLTKSDLPSLTVAANQNNTGLGVIYNNTIQYYDGKLGQFGTGVASTTATPINVDNVYLYAGSDSMDFFVPPHSGNWKVGGGSGSTAISASSGNNTLIGSAGSSFMGGGSGDNFFIIPDATLTGKVAWDTITDLHAGDIVTLTGISNDKWQYAFSPTDMGSPAFSGLTLEARCMATPSLVLNLTFSNLHSQNLSSLILSQGTGANIGNLIITM